MSLLRLASPVDLFCAAPREVYLHELSFLHGSNLGQERSDLVVDLALGPKGQAAIREAEGCELEAGVVAPNVLEKVS
eukprot:111787-Hanusia_phi.AAC.1